MKLSKPIFLTLASSFLFAVAAASGACSSSVAVTTPTASMPPQGITFVGGDFGGRCSGKVFVAAGVGWAFCNDDKWAYTTTDPSTDGYMELSGTDAAADDDASPAHDDGGQGNDGSSASEGGQGHDAGPADDGGQSHDATPADDGGQQSGDGGQRGIEGGQGHDGGQQGGDGGLHH
jgi:hypothetical protein